MVIINFSDFLLEHKLWYKTITQFLRWLEEKSYNMDFVFTDTETTGLGGPKKKQLTQISAISSKYFISNNTFIEKDTFSHKIKLTPETRQKKLTDSDINRALKLNRYGDTVSDYLDERETVKMFYDWLKDQKNPLLVMQNAEFDMNMINARTDIRFNNEVLDTKQIIQLYFIPLIQKLAETDDKYRQMVSKIGTSTRDGGLISSSMSRIGPALGLDMSGYHDALTDCRITMEMFKGIIKLLKEYSHVDIMKYQVERIKVIKK
ncbi:MAG: PolC-type DNA polymerase III [bacterium]